MQCQIAFEMPVAQTATTLSYDDQRGDTASAPIPAIMLSGSCQTVMGWGSSGPCNLCLLHATPIPDAGAVGTCTAAFDSYESSCISCDEQCINASDRCACETGCDSSTCKTLFDTAMTCVVDACSSSCM
jgi:hypothetical protein